MIVDPGHSLVIRFSDPNDGAYARIALTDDERVLVNVSSGAPAFTSDPYLLVIDASSVRDTFEIRIPRPAPRVEIAIGDRAVFLKEGARVTTDGAPDARGWYLLPLYGTER